MESFISNLTPIAYIVSSSSPLSSNSLTSFAVAPTQPHQTNDNNNDDFSALKMPTINQNVYRICFTANNADNDCSFSSISSGDGKSAIEDDFQLNKIYYDPEKKESSAYV